MLGIGASLARLHITMNIQKYLAVIHRQLCLEGKLLAIVKWNVLDARGRY